MCIVFLPLDSRPLNYDFPQKLAKLQNIEIKVPPKSIMDFFKKPGNTRELQIWLKKECASADILILSIEQLVYGGLIASRSNTKTKTEIKKTFHFISALKQINPSLLIFAFSVMMRTTVSTLNEQTKRWWEKIAEYSKLQYAYETAFGDEKVLYKKALDDLLKDLPPYVVSDFLEAREKSHWVNMLCIEFAEKNIFEKLFLLQEDCSSHGLQVIEQERLINMIFTRNLQEKVFLHNGTDEAGTELVSRCVFPKPVSVSVEWLFQNNSFTAKYEDRPFIENLCSHLTACEIHVKKSSRCCLLILPPKDSQGDFCPNCLNTAEYSPDEYRIMTDRIDELIKKGKSCYLLDLVYANGGDRVFIKTLAAKTNILNLCGYAAWNTASNSLGTIIGQIIASGGKNSCENKKLTAERVLDDLLYQSLIRQKLGKILVAKKEDSWCLSDPTAAQETLQRLFCDSQEDLYDVFGTNIPDFCVELVWPRIFEAAFTVFHV